MISTDDEKVLKLSDEDFSALVKYLQKAPIPYLRMERKTTRMILKVKGVKIISLFW